MSSQQVPPTTTFLLLLQTPPEQCLGTDICRVAISACLDSHFLVSQTSANLKAYGARGDRDKQLPVGTDVD